MSDPYAYKRDVRLQARLSAEIQALLKLPPNSECADCGATRTVRFTSVTLGIFLCNRCYGIHRSVGAHITRTKCVGLDTWSPGEVEAMRAMGNTQAKACFEAVVPAGVARATASSTDREAERWIRDKYERRLYYAAAPAGADTTTATREPTVSAPAHTVTAVFPAAVAPASDWATFENIPSAPAPGLAWLASFETSLETSTPSKPTCSAGAAPGVSANATMCLDPFCVAAGGFPGGSAAPSCPSGSGSCLLD